MTITRKIYNIPRKDTTPPIPPGSAVVPDTVIVNRKDWIRGKGPSEYYEDPEGKRCAAGFLVQVNNIEVRKRAGAILRGLPHEEQAYFVKQMFFLNDTPTLSDNEREEKLKELYLKIGVDLVFVD